ncbi:MAG: thioredoxin domain-containing protein [Solirubrobacterales bacterium]|nr:thioredoxin domain-containing protein [Solirubrobacterales bacterium]MCB8915081.1 thioredoxin domain-containing protein [Thermoleophilales bacterium]
MATPSQQKRKELREKRMQAEQASQSADKRQNLIKILGIAAFLVVVGVVVAVVAISSGGGSDDNQGSADIDKLLAGIPQNGTTLGKPDSKITLYEFGDLQCPICDQYSKDATPDIINNIVRPGKAKWDFKQWAILGPDSALAAKAALAAAEQNRYWEYIENFYANQGLENSGYVTDDFLTDIANDAGVPDIDQWNKDRESAAIAKQVEETDAQATNLGFSGTPSFAIQVGNGDIQPVQTSSSTAAADEIAKAIDKAQSGS